jgi:hypothetical protein
MSYSIGRSPDRKWVLGSPWFHRKVWSIWWQYLSYLLYIIDGQVCLNNYNILPFIVCRPRKTNFCFLSPFAENKRKFAISVFVRSQQMAVAVFLKFNFLYIHNIYTLTFQRKTENGSLGDSLNPFTVCSSKFVICPFVDKETKKIICLQMD